MTQRTILFRAWDIERKKWLSNDCHKFGWYIDPEDGIVTSTGYDSYDNPTFESDGILKRPQSDFILEQFTGLTDKNGVKIFEGDIVKCPTATEPEENGFIVGFKSHRLFFSNVNYPDLNTYGSDNWEYFSKYSEVIGNIHSNHELI